MGGIDALLSIVQMPGGIPVGTLGEGRARAANAAFLAIEILALSDKDIDQRIVEWRSAMTARQPEVPE